MNKLTLPTVLISLSIALPAIAKGPHHNNSDWAKVTDVDPITHTVEYRTPHKKCWNERSHYQQPRQKNNSMTVTIMGGIIGGALGNAVGHSKKNKQVGAVVGSILGASVGHSLSDTNSYNRHSNTSYYNSKRCTVEDKIRYKEEIIGYRVSYRYRGNEYRARMNHHPGKRLKVRVSVEPY
jgi:uncharacterized protein YcfJ